MELYSQLSQELTLALASRPPGLGDDEDDEDEPLTKRKAGPSSEGSIARWVGGASLAKWATS